MNPEKESGIERETEEEGVEREREFSSFIIIAKISIAKTGHDSTKIKVRLFTLKIYM